MVGAHLDVVLALTGPRRVRDVAQTRVSREAGWTEGGRFANVRSAIQSAGRGSPGDESAPLLPLTPTTDGRG